MGKPEDFRQGSTRSLLLLVLLSRAWPAVSRDCSSWLTPLNKRQKNASRRRGRPSRAACYVRRASFWSFDVRAQPHAARRNVERMRTTHVARSTENE